MVVVPIVCRDPAYLSPKLSKDMSESVKTKTSGNLFRATHHDPLLEIAAYSF